MIEITTADDADLKALQALLRDADLPDDVGEHPGTIVRIARRKGLVVGGIAVEGYGEHGLLRSLVVHPAHRGRGLGGRLTAAIADAAAGMGRSALYLLTETAQDFFEKRGFTRIGRDEAPAALQASSEVAVLCPETAVTMARSL